MRALLRLLFPAFSGTSRKGCRGQNLKALQGEIWLEMIQFKARRTTAAGRKELSGTGITGGKNPQPP